MTRSQIMARIGPKDTKPELVIRKGLHRIGYRFRLHQRHLPGKPDLVLPRFRAVIFVHGCFWHAHCGCRYFRYPKTRTDFWHDKLNRNVERDAEAQAELISGGWRVLTVWECATRNVEPEVLCSTIANWLNAGNVSGEIPSSSANT
ncbi:very short patch repair endonuclease [uncultured Tateyamaria sp.]|uniref:very short patch repair endonuclease n=1 Tax=uncultured Tateyamaria sp. TaxID=455651 RepID=UPI0026379572|nr:very short patch repair endonuclease [uncultured Tateyamaria sp.]